MKIFLTIVVLFVVAAYLFKRFGKPAEIRELEDRIKKAKKEAKKRAQS